MLTTTRAAMRLSAIGIGIIVINFPTLPIRAQSTTAESFNFEEISVGGEDNWDFPSENETASIRDELQQLGEYNISGAENFDLKLIQRNRRGGIRSNRPNYFIENGVAPYYSIKTRIYGY